MAQDSGPADPWMTDAQNAISAFQQHPSPRQVVVVFDISGSMRSRVPETSLTRWQEARRATAQLLLTTLKPGDSLTILPFDSIVHPPREYPDIKGGQLATIGTLIPDAISGESGTNMRLAHHQALRILQRQRDAIPGKKPWQAIVVVSDGFNDAPPLHSPPWDDYARYCNVHSDNQNLYPPSPECNAWRAEAGQFEKAGQGQTFGIGVKIEDGVPEYRPPNEKPAATVAAAGENATGISGSVFEGSRPSAGVRVEALDVQGNIVDVADSRADGQYSLSGLAAGTYVITAAKGNEAARIAAVATGTNGVDLHMTQNHILLWVAVLVVLLIAVVASMALASGRRAAKVRIQIKDSSGKNRTYWMGGGTTVRIGGPETPGVFPMEAFAAPVAQLRHTAGGFTLMTEKSVEAETGGRKFTGYGPVDENALILVKDSDGHQGTFEFRDISTRTRTSAAAVTGQPGAGPGSPDPYSKLDATLKG